MKKVTYLILTGAILGVAAGALFYLFNRYVGPRDIVEQRTETQGTPSGDIYEGLREQALAVTPETLELTQQGNEVIVHGIVFDWNLGEGIATLVAFQTGDVSYYLSTGGGAIGGGSHENVRRAAADFLDEAQRNLSKSSRTSSTPLPGMNSMKFYLLTNKGTFVADEHMEHIEDESSKWLSLFLQANHVITEMRKSTGG